MSNFIEPEFSKNAAKDFAVEYCERVDRMFIENLTEGVNVNTLLQECLDTTSRSYGFKVDE